MNPHDVHTPDDFARFLAEQRAETDQLYATPRWERVLLAVVLTVLVGVLVSLVYGVVTTIAGAA